MTAASRIRFARRMLGRHAVASDCLGQVRLGGVYVLSEPSRQEHGQKGEHARNAEGAEEFHHERQRDGWVGPFRQRSLASGPLWDALRIAVTLAIGWALRLVLPTSAATRTAAA